MRIGLQISLLVVVVVAAALAGCGGKGAATPSIIIPGDGYVVPEDAVDAAGDLGLPDLPTGPCASDKECGDYYCDQKTSSCVECLINNHCPPGYRCEKGACVPKEGGCVSDAQCTAAGLICDEEQGECVECVESPDCIGDEYCLEGKCLPWVCTPEARWCQGSRSKGCNEDGSAIAIDEECDDGSACTEGDGCVNGLCAEAIPLDCDDHNPCTADDCDPESGCFHQFLDGPCEDGTPCTEGDHCENGQCVPGELVCECASDGDCIDQDDDDLCNGVLSCVDGFCVLDPESVVTCEVSEDPCLTIECNPKTGACDETVAPDGEACDDEDKCTTEDLCQDGECVGQAKSCDDKSPCTNDSCDPELGCIFEPTSGGACNDGNKCTASDACKDGVCIGQEIDCEDGNPCTDNYCLPATGCQLDELTGPCEDGDLCTVDDTCVDAVCKGVALVCEDDGNFCTNDFCDPAVGCVHQPNDLPCDDGNVCTLSDHCSGGECVPGELLFDCDDENPCTTDSCNAETGECIHTPNSQPCDDGDACTLGDQCANTICVSGAPKDCDDGNVCTEDLCNVQGECKHTAVAGPCEDGNACTGGDQCVGGVCQPGQPVSCNDSNACTDDTCDPVEGCVNTPNQAACNDGNACTLGDQCVDGACVGTEPLDCEDNNLCTDDSCDPEGGCVNTFNNNPCDDDNACTDGDYCAAGICISGATIDCDDNEGCTDDSCNPATGCVHAPNANLCEDGDPCTFDDYCSNGACVGGELEDCDDGNPCTEDVCNFDGCLHPMMDGACDDGNPCTVDDICDGGLCQGDLVANCGCYSLKLDGAGDYGQAADAPAFNLGATYTVELWVKQPIDADAAGERGLLCQWRWAGNNDRSWCLVAGENNVFTFRARVTDPNGQANATISAPVPLTGTWHHVAVVADGQERRFYVDGALAQTVAGAADPLDASVPLLVGARFDPDVNGVGGFFNGTIDELRVSNAALYSGQGFQPEPWLAVTGQTVAYWGANQNQYSTLFDLGAGSLHAALSGNPVWSSDTPAEVCVPKANFPPSQPVVHISPANPKATDDLECVFDEESTDMENDPITYTYAWYLNGVLQPAHTGQKLPASATADCPMWDCAGCQTWTCKVTPSDTKPGLPGSASAVVGKSQCKNCNGAVWNTHCYTYVGGSYQWGTAMQLCQGWGGHLVTIDSEAENNYVDGLCPGACWIGLNDVASEGNYQWTSGTPYSGVNFWRWQQPNNGGWFGNQDCIMMCENCGWGAPSGQWDDQECDDTYGYVCEATY